MRLLAGTSGYSYKEWKGAFYPEKIAAKDMLAFYASRLSVVEINNTFYRLPKREVMETWAGEVPDSFRFVIKASRRITHFGRLAGVEDETEYLLKTIDALGERLGGVLFQLPPNFKLDLGRLEGFLTLLAGRVRAAFEFRHDSWADPGVAGLLRAHGCPLVLSDTDEAETPEIVPTGEWGYLRLRRVAYTDDDLRAWLDRLLETGWKEAYVFFKHEDEATGPRLAERFLELGAGK